MRLARASMSLAVAALLGGAVVAPATAQAKTPQPETPAGQAARELRADNAVDPLIRTEDGLLRTVSARPGHPLGRPDGVPAGAPAETVARAFLDTYGDGFGLPAGDAGLTTEDTRRTADGGRIVRFQQRLGDVPVLGGDMIVSTDASGHVLSSSGEVTPAADAPTTPRISEARAVRRALAAAPGGTTGVATRWIYDPKLIGGPGAGARQVWRVEVTSSTDRELQRLVLVDAALGSIVLNLDLRAHAKQRLICDYTGAQNVSSPSCASGSSKLVRTEGAGASGVNDVDKAYEYLGATYDFYHDRFGRDSIDGAGLPLRAAVRVCVATCPYNNAYWDGQMMVFGSGFADADDVVGHELTHGVTEHTSGLFYGYQSGAINESLSDVMGEFIDQGYANGTKDGPQYDWLIGEDLPIGAIRSMADPTAYGSPDRMTSDLYEGETHFADPVSPDDSGGVHTNSGVGNKAAYLMAAPGTREFNGVTVTGIGVDKAAQVYYRAMSLLTSGSDYADLAAALDSACAGLVTGQIAGLTSSDCEQVTAATTAVEMTAEPTAADAQAPDVPLCPSGQVATLDASDGFENGLGDWTVTGDYYDGFSYVDGYAHGGTKTLYAQTAEFDAAAKQTATWGSTLNLPPGRDSYVWFAHAYDFDTRSGAHYDGARVEYRVGSGAWQNAASLMTGGYTGNLTGTAGTGAAFVGDSHGYRSTRIDLSAYAGSSVQLRFSTLADAQYGSYWLIDDLQAYGCAGDGTSVRGLAAVAGAPGTATLSWDELPGATGYTIAGSAAGLPRTIEGTSTTLTGLDLASSHTITVTPVLDGGYAATVTVRRSTVALAAKAATIAPGGTAVLAGAASVVGGVPSGSVRLYSRRTGTASWAAAGTASVGSSGAFSFSQKPAYNMEYRAETYGGANQVSNTSPVASVGVVPVLTIKPSLTYVKRYGTVWFTGTTKPTYAYATTTIQVYVAGSWRAIATTRTYSGGNYSISAKLTAKGKWIYRAVVTGGNTYASATSGTVLITTS